MYPQVSTAKGQGSVARLGVMTAPKSGSLSQGATTQFHYIQGLHTDPNKNSGIAFTSKSLTAKTLANGDDSIAWTDIFTPESTHREETPAVRRYLVNAKKQIVVFEVTVWDVSTLNKTTEDFEKALMTYKDL